MRGLNVLAGVLLFAVGMVVTFTTWTVDGWTVLAAVGCLMLGADLYLDSLSYGLDS